MTLTGAQARLALAISIATVVFACTSGMSSSGGGPTFLVACNDGTGSTDCCPTIADAGAHCDGTTARCSTGCQAGLRGYLYCVSDGLWTAPQGLSPCSAAVGSCPSTPPVSGSPCTAPWVSTNSTDVIAHCSWGDDPRPWCRTTAVCEPDGTWLLSAPSANCSVPLLPPACPSPPPASGTNCNDAALDCWYPDGSRCRCSSCMGGSMYPYCQPIDPPQWACSVPAPGCPALIPQAGSSCDTLMASCGPECTLRIACENRVWQWHRGACPKCAAPDTPIGTPLGDRPIASLGVGDLVYSVDHDAIVVVPIVAASHTTVRAHHVMRIELEGGAVLEMSPGHPTADGRPFGELGVGSLLDEQHKVVRARLVPFTHEATYDILPGSSTGAYFAAGVLVGSTLKH